MTDFATYAAIPAINWSTLKEMARSPRHYQHRLQTPREDSPAMRFGRAVHTSVLEPDRFPVEYAVYDGTRRGKEWAEFAAVNEARTILTRAEYDTCLAVRDAVRADPVAQPLLEGGDAEMTLQWTDKDTGLKCKSRLDYYVAGRVVDLKTTRGAGADEFAKTAARLMYVHQLAFYCMGAQAVSISGNMPDAVIIAVESEPPHDVCVYRISESDLETATYEVKDLLQKVADCTRSGKWPGRFTKAETLQMPWWAFAQDDSEFDLTGLGIFKGEK